MWNPFYSLDTFWGFVRLHIRATKGSRLTQHSNEAEHRVIPTDVRVHLEVAPPSLPEEEGSIAHDMPADERRHRVTLGECLLGHEKGACVNSTWAGS